MTLVCLPGLVSFVSDLFYYRCDIRWTQSAYWRAPANPIPKGTLLFFVVYISHCDAIFISQYIGTPVTDVITSSPSWQKCTILGSLMGPGALQWSNWAYLVSQVSFHPYLCTCKNRSNVTTTFYVQYPKYEQNIIIFTFGGSWGPLRQTQGCQFVMEVGPYDIADMYNKGTK